MTDVRNTSNRTYISQSVGRVEPGDTVDAPRDKAAYLVEETGYFEYVDGPPDDGGNTDEGDTDGGEDTDAESERDDEDGEDLDDLLKDELLEMADEEEISGRHSMTKAELIIALEDAEE